MVLDDPQLWDAAAIDAVLAYTAGPKQAWDNTELARPWLKGMRNSLNAQVCSFKEPHFLCVSATHGSAHLALFDQHLWERYQLPELIGPRCDPEYIRRAAIPIVLSRRARSAI
jgi:hypothetical protein